MTVVTITQKEYRSMQGKAALYDRMVRPISRAQNAFPIEEYSRSDIRGIIRADKLPKTAVARLSKLLKSI